MQPRWHQECLGGAQHGVNSNPALVRFAKREAEAEAKSGAAAEKALHQKPIVASASRQAKPKPKSSKPQLECLKCTKRYSAKSIQRGEYRLETFLCSNCYAQMQQQPYSACCFGKPSYTVTPENPQRQYGYNPKAIECKQLCPDRQVCKLVVQGPSQE